MMASMAAGGPGDPHTQMNTYRSYVTMLADPGAKDEIKLKAAQELSENFEVCILCGLTITTTGIDNNVAH